MTKLERIEFVEVLKKLRENEDFIRLLDLMPKYKNHKIVDAKFRRGAKDYEVNEWELLIFELEDLEEILKQ
ncbi:MAG: hypothetical protein ACRCX7_07085 [Cetobacterium sp.]|uniref:hypothetical protein n=1 Tax=Cetobacterium sp. TaxID=2071632 RepID=UPI003F2D021B